MVKRSRTDIRRKSIEKSVTVSQVLLRDRVWLYLEAIITCMPRLLMT